jgi:pyridoxamine 5'-phosphate oxidase
VAVDSVTTGDFTEADDPFPLFALWFKDASAKELNDPEAMTLATVDEAGLPDARTLLCKGVDRQGLVFYGNVESAKGRELSANPRAAALFHWKSLRRQARFRGPVGPLTDAEVDAYFHSRPRQSRIGAWASQQSRPLESRAALVTAVEAYAKRFGEGDIPRPPAWRGWRLAPLEIEFWQDGAFRLHDRVLFRRASLDAPWERRRLFP